jgi:hypothetical protein
MSTRSSSQLSVFEPLTDATDDPKEILVAKHSKHFADSFILPKQLIHNSEASQHHALIPALNRDKSLGLL